MSVNLKACEYVGDWCLGPLVHCLVIGRWVSHPLRMLIDSFHHVYVSANDVWSWVPIRVIHLPLDKFLSLIVGIVIGVTIRLTVHTHMSKNM